MGRLAGLRIVVTRAAQQAGELAEAIRREGGHAILLPAICIVPPKDAGPLRRAAAELDGYDWVVFTSANAVHGLEAVAPGAGQGYRGKCATVGIATREAAEAAGFRVAMMPTEAVGEELARAFAGEDVAGRRILMPSAAVRRDVVAPVLRERGAQVDVIEAYANEMPRDLAGRAREIFRDRFPDWVTFASPSAARNVVGAAGVETLARVRIASIGPTTSEALRGYGLQVTAEAREQSVRGLVDAMA